MRNQMGFGIIEAVISVVLFGTIILGSTILLSNHESGLNNAERAAKISKTAWTFLSEVSETVRDTDTYDFITVTKNTNPVLVALNGVNFLEAPASTNAEVQQMIDRWTAGERSKFDRLIGNYADAWVVTTQGREIKLHFSAGATHADESDYTITLI